MDQIGSGIDELTIEGGHCLLPEEGLRPANILCSGGLIAAIDAPSPARGVKRIDATGCLVLPGIVDVHGDAFERQIMPRPRTLFPLDIAMLESDRQLVANGITTAYHGITVSWEPGLRSLEQSQKVIQALDDLEDRLLADNRLHIRWETYAIDEMAEVVGMFSRPKKPALAFNDHTSPGLDGIRKDIKIRGSAERAMVDLETYRELLQGQGERAPEVAGAIDQICAAARESEVPMLSHDDAKPAIRQEFREKGVCVAEFPMNWETLEHAAAAGDDIVLGSPNVVRGGSHNGAIGAEEAIIRGQCSILATDYYYPAPLQAALSLGERKVLPLADAWQLVSESPARAMKLLDRGRIETGLRADLILVPRTSFRVVAAIVGGRVAYSTL
jgi:alpha-D-ribose 1-methylphosphonate 5-triphosphate diphosphatase